MNPETLPVLLEDNHLLGVLKPAGMLTMGDDTGDATAADLARQYLKDRYNKPGNVYVGVVHRLDRPVSGVLLLARTSKAASRLSDQFRRGAVQKTYVAVVQGIPAQPSGELCDWLRKDRTKNHVMVARPHSAGARESRLRYRVLRSDGERSWLEIQPLTGRSHQIRVQLSALGHPILGDVRYGAAQGLGHRILLHASRLEFQHPTQKTDCQLESAVPADFEL